MASEERIPHAAEAEVAASASPTSAAGAGASDTSGGTQAATSGESKNAAAVEVSSTASATGNGKAKSGNGSNGGNNNNQHRRKGSNKYHHQNHNQHQRHHHKSGHNNNNNNNNNNNHRQQYQQRHQNRPGAYVPVHPRPISPPLSMQNPPPPLDLAARRSGLLEALTPQLEYYFSAANLSGDTYLRTLMGLNSGYVPVAAVATFGNVQRIVMRWDGGIPPTASTSPNPEDPLGGPLVRSEKEGVAGFVAAAAWDSQFLDVVEIDADGKVVRTVCSADGKAQDGEKGEGENKKKEEKDGIQGNEAKDKKSGFVAADIRIAIGPVGGGEMSKSTAATGGSGGTKTNDAPIATPVPTAPMQAAPEQTTIILRDAPEATTENDIRSVFTAAKTTVTNVHPDVGNTWFVSLDAKTTSRDNVVSLLLSLRGMKLHGEPIKARLKTESVASRRGTASGGYGYAASAPQSPVTGRPGRFQQHGAGPMASTGINRAAQPGRGGGGGGMRPHHIGQSRSVPSSPIAGGRNSNYCSGKAGGRGGKNIVALGSGPSNKARRGSRNGDLFKATSSSDDISSPKGAGTSAKTSPSAVPPPPLAGLHFPALGGDNSDGDKTPASQLQHRPKGAAPTVSDDTDDSKKLDFAEKPNKDETAPATKQPVGGYAAALRKAAPAKAVGAEEKKVATTSAAVGSDGKALKLPPSTGGQGPSSRVSKSTTLTDDSSADDKSSVSSKPESIESHPAITPVAPSWGGGNTFADILKKKQQAAAAAAASAAADSAGAEQKSDDKPTEK